jgi:hypothetical protein
MDELSVETASAADPKSVEVVPRVGSNPTRPILLFEPVVERLVRLRYSQPSNDEIF